MKVKKVLNNNIILSYDQKGQERMLLGKGIGFNVKVDSPVDESKVDKVFILETKEMTDKLANIMEDIPSNHLELTRLIIEDAEKELGCKFNDSIYIGLTDHINYALTRAKESNLINNALLWEVKRFYPKEFKAAQRSLEIIQYQEHVQLNEDEASFIAIHFLNGQQEGKAVRETVEATTVIQDILNIIKFHYKMDLCEDSINYTRFITHVRFFLERVRQNRINGTEDDFLFEQVRQKYPETYACVLRIKVYLLEKLGVTLTNEEMLYFMLHVQRLTQRELNKNGM